MRRLLLHALSSLASRLSRGGEVERLAALLDEFNVGLIAVNSTDQLATINNSAAALLDIPPGRTTAARFTNAVTALARRALNQTEIAATMNVVAGNPTAQFTSTWVFAGDPKYIGVVSRPAAFAGPVDRIWAIYDNSHVAQAIEDDRQADSLIRASSDVMLDPQVLLEAVWQEGRVVDLVHRDINAAGCAYFGMSRDEFIGRSMFDPNLLDQYAKCITTGEPVILDAFPYRSEFVDAMRYYDVRGFRVRPGMMVTTWRDVTDKRQWAERIAASEEQFRLLTENVADVVMHLTDDGVIRWVSRSIEEALGTPPDHLLQRSVFDLLVPERRAGAKQRWGMITGGQSYIGQTVAYGADGAKHWIHLHSKPFHDADGKRDGIVASFRVIDDEVAAEKAAAAAIARRDERNRRLTRYLKAQTNRLMAELNSAARYVASILPDDLTGPVAVTSRYLPTEELGGDCYDFRWLDDDHLIVYLVDVSGHGVEPALLSVSVHNLLRSCNFETETLLAPDAVLRQLNRIFQMDQQGGHYFTIWYGVFQASRRELRYSSAGHPPALALTRGATPEPLATGSAAIGLLEDTEFVTHSFTVPPATEILLYSDGALELGLPEGQQRSLNEFCSVYLRAAQNEDGTLNTLIAKLEEGSSRAVVTDDSTFVRLSIP